MGLGGGALDEPSEGPLKDGEQGRARGGGRYVVSHLM